MHGVTMKNATDPSVTIKYEVCFEHLRNSAFQGGLLPFFLELVYNVKVV
jgi:hypothetical protein